MSLEKIISSDSIIPLMRATNEKSVGVALSKRAGKILGLDASDIAKAIFDHDLNAKQRVSMGVAIFHISLPSLKSSHAIFARLETSVDFTSVDGEPVDLVLLLVTAQSGNNRHLQTLAGAAAAHVRLRPYHQYDRPVRRHNRSALRRGRPDG